MWPLLLVAVARAGCMEQHVLDAIAMNTERRAIYAEISGGLSLPVSDRLLASEQLTLPVARAFDRRARPYQAEGIGLMCDEFVSMEGVRPAERAASVHAPPDVYRWVAAENLPSRLRSAWKAGRFAAVEVEADAIVGQLAVAPDGLCMTRHLVESIRRAARLAPEHAAAARGAGFVFRNPERISFAFLALQVAALPAAITLDRDAEGSHAAGAPILCHDLPPIP